MDENILEGISFAVKTTDEGTMIRMTMPNGQVWWVPQAEGNGHYQWYLQWLAEGNTAEVIDS